MAAGAGGCRRRVAHVKLGHYHMPNGKRSMSFEASAKSFKKSIRNMCVEASMRSNFVSSILGRNIWSVYDYMFSPNQLIFLAQCLAETRDVPGCCAEIGCAYGRTTAFLRKFMNENEIHKGYYAIDTFAGFVPEHLDYEAEQRNKDRTIDQWFVNNKKKWFDHSLKISNVDSVVSIESDAAKFDFDSIGPIAFALLDVDLYLPMIDILPKLYRNLSSGGMILVDDCMPHAHWDGALVAYEEFVAKNGIERKIMLNKIGIITKS
jgi:O-methyltransferase